MEEMKSQSYTLDEKKVNVFWREWVCVGFLIDLILFIMLAISCKYVYNKKKQWNRIELCMEIQKVDPMNVEETSSIKS